MNWSFRLLWNTSMITGYPFLCFLASGDLTRGHTRATCPSHRRSNQTPLISWSNEVSCSCCETAEQKLYLFKKVVGHVFQFPIIIVVTRQIINKKTKGKIWHTLSNTHVTVTAIIKMPYQSTRDGQK